MRQRVIFRSNNLPELVAIININSLDVIKVITMFSYYYSLISSMQMSW